MTITIDDSHIKGSLFSNVCSFCKHYPLLPSKLDRPVCKAFPQGIPPEIWIGENKHVDNFLGDRGIKFEPR